MRVEMNNLKVWMYERGLSAEQVTFMLGYADKIMITHARQYLHGAPSVCFINRFDTVFGQAETDKAFPNAPEIRKLPHRGCWEWTPGVIR
jgi:hypothetical protein